jgi:hypothetical protein
MSVFNNFVKHTTFLTFFLCFVIQTSAFTGKYPIQILLPNNIKLVFRTLILLKMRI